MFKKGALLVILIVVLIFIVPNVNAQEVGYAPDPSCGEEVGIFIPDSESGPRCIACDGRTSSSPPSSPISDGICLDDISDNHCLINDAYDPDCSYGNVEKGANFDFCGDSWDNDGDGYIDYNDAECEISITSVTQSPNPVSETNQVIISCALNPLLNGASSTVNFQAESNKAPIIEISRDGTLCTPITWSGNTAQATCSAGQSTSVLCGLVQSGIPQSPVTVLTLNLELECTPTTWYRDEDRDGYGTSSETQSSCTDPGTEWVSNSDDCNDLDFNVKPGVAESCDGIDNDCNPSTSDGSGETWFGQTTSCGIGECASTGTYSCSAGNQVNSCAEGTSTNEICDGKDNDCDGSFDEDVSGNPLTQLVSCGYGDCQETVTQTCISPGVWTGAACKPGTPTTWYRDADSDGYGTSSETQFICTNPGIGWVSNSEDCNDLDFNVKPGGIEICDNKDNDCNPSTSDGSGETWFGQTTSCGIGECASTGTYSCSAGNQVNSCAEGTSTNEICDGKDNDCDGSFDEDISGNPLTQTCNPSNACSPGIETCSEGFYQGCTAIISVPETGSLCMDGEDNDCDGLTDYDSLDGFHGDNDCPLTSSLIELSASEVINGGKIDITCTVFPFISRGFNSIFAYQDNNKDGIYNTGDLDFGWDDNDGWNSVGDKVNFNNEVVTGFGDMQIGCGIYSSISEPNDRSYQSGIDTTTTIRIIPSECGSRSQNDCTGSCKWVDQCDTATSSPDYSGSVSRCVPATTDVSYSCNANICGGANGDQCDGSTTLTTIRCDSYCSGNSLVTSGNDVTETCDTNTCTINPVSCAIVSTDSCGTTSCDPALNLVTIQACDNLCNEEGTQNDGTDATCGTCTPTCGCAPGFYDHDPNIDGCEYPCTISNGGVEICDGKDNDCDGSFDEDVSGNPLTQTCGSDLGECTSGVAICSGGNFGSCSGQGAVAETGTTLCSDNKDNDCDGQSDYDSFDGLHGDNDCQISISGVPQLSVSEVVDGGKIDITCTTSPFISRGFNSIFAYIDSNENGQFDLNTDTDLEWDSNDGINPTGDNINFNQETVTGSGNVQIGCGVYSSISEPNDRSYQGGVDTTTTIRIIPSECGSRSQNDCTGSCKWVEQCRDDPAPHYSEGLTRCIDANLAVNYVCSASICEANGDQCDGSTTLGTTSCSNYCDGNSLFTYSVSSVTDSCNFGTCTISTASCPVPSSTDCGTISCDPTGTLHLVGTPCEKGCTGLAESAKCGTTCTPTCSCDTANGYYDLDGDLSDGCEDPNNVDTDGDGLSDGIEDPNHNRVVEAGETNPDNPDTDGDGACDGPNAILGVCVAGDPAPRNQDFDGELILDGEELQTGADTYITNPAERDTDFEGLSDYQEINPAIGVTATNPTNPDTDGDGVCDGPLAVPNVCTAGPDPAPTQANEDCTTDIDEDGNGESGYDNSNGQHGDVTCPLLVSNIDILSTNPDAGDAVIVKCTSSVGNVNSISATIGGTTCTFLEEDSAYTNGWEGNKAVFSCITHNVCPAIETIRCFIDTSKSYAVEPTEQMGTVDVACGNCATYGSSGTCDGDTRCEWCPENGPNNQWRGASGNVCVNVGSCSYECTVDKNNAQCDNTNGEGEGSFTETLCDNYCSGNSLVTRGDDVINTCNDGTGADDCTLNIPSCTVISTNGCGTTSCDANLNLVGADCTNTCLESGSQNDGFDATCATACTPTCECAPGFYDYDGTYGCEYPCTISNGGVEICDGIDNDCDGIKDNGVVARSCGTTDVGECTFGEETCKVGGTGVWEGCTANFGEEETGSVLCRDGKDNDCDGNSDYDTILDPDLQGNHGDDGCPVAVTSTVLSSSLIRAGTDKFDVGCMVSPVSPIGFNSIFAYVDNDNTETFTNGDRDLGWVDETDGFDAGFTKVYFRQRTIADPGFYQIACGVLSSSTEPDDRSFQIEAVDPIDSIEVIPTECSARGLKSTCTSISDCMWIEECRNSPSPHYSGEESRCVPVNTEISYSCNVDQCSSKGEVCDGSTLLTVCPDTSVCSGKVFQTRTPSCDLTGSCTCQYSDYVNQACNTENCNADCDAGTTEDTGTDYCAEDGSIYNQINGCSTSCVWEDLSATDTLVATCVDDCSDTDTGRRFETKGTVTDRDLCSSEATCPTPIEKVDTCNGNTLTEYFCTSNNWNSETLNCNDLDDVTPNEGTDECTWNDFSCGAGACTSTSPTTVQCDAFDDTNGLDGTIADYEATSASCTLGCTGNNCCSSVSHISDGRCETADIEGVTYISYRDLTTNVWGTSAQSNEICGDGFDNNCNGLTDSDDPQCVTITSVSVPSQVTQTETFQLRCGSTTDSNCVGATISSGTCTFTDIWEGTEAIFDCQADIAGNIDLSCFISNKPGGFCTVSGETAIPIESSQIASTLSIASECSARSVTDCSFGGACEYCPTCGSVENVFNTNEKFSSGLTNPGVCVPSGDCSDKYQCRNNECGATCDANTWANCLGYQECGIDSCGCSDKFCTVGNLGESSTHGETTEIYVCAGTLSSQTWTLSTDVLTEDQYACNDGKDNDGDTLPDCADPDCNGLTNSAGAICCSGSAPQTTCDALDTSCSNFDSCSNDATKRGTRTTYTCTDNVCQGNTPIACDVGCSSGCCIPGQDSCSTEGVSSSSDIDSDNAIEICHLQDWLGADCSIDGCISTDEINYECISPSDCSLNAGTCGLVTCENYQCGTQKIADPITKCSNVASNLGYECAITDTDPDLACIEETPGEFNCVFFGEPSICGEDKNPSLGFDAACDENFQCDINLCSSAPDACTLCHSQCKDIAQNDPGRAPFDVDECEQAENSHWVNTIQCLAGGS